MSQALLNKMTAMEEKLAQMENIIKTMKEGFDSSMGEELKELKAKYHMLNARLSKYKID